MKRPDFDSIKTYEEFKKYKWTRYELVEICKARGLLYIGSQKKLERVIESYFNGVKIPPRRNWYTNKVMNNFVNDNGGTMVFDFVTGSVSLIMFLTGYIRYNTGIDDLTSVPFIVFGGVGLIIAIFCFHWDRVFDVIKSYFPVCGDKRFTRTQVDEQINSDKTEDLHYGDIYLAPDMLIGVSAGVAAVAYEDIDSILVRQTRHSERIGAKGSNRYKEYFIYKIIVRTNKGKRIVISKSRNDATVTAGIIHGQCLAYNPNVKLLDMRKSPLADDETKQTISGNDIKRRVEDAVKEQALTNIMVDEELKKEFIGFHRRFAFIFIPESLLVLVMGVAIAFVMIYFLHLIRISMFLIICILSPIYAVYNLFSTLNAIRKDDVEFYSGEIASYNDKGYLIKGLGQYRFGYIRKMQPYFEPKIGDKVIIARFKDEFSLIAELEKRHLKIQ